jgi:hypothetical protein
MPIMQIAEASMRALSEEVDPQPETGMELQIAVTENGLLAIMSNGMALPCYPTPHFYDINDLLTGIPLAVGPAPPPVVLAHLTQVIKSRLEASSYFPGAPVPQPVPPMAAALGPHPLLRRTSLIQPMIFFRFISNPIDFRFVNNQLLAGTYVSTMLEHRTANSGFAAVGRFALPLPAPASYVFQYGLPAGTIIDAGTVAPLFGQSGGGVEILVLNQTPVTQYGPTQMPEF